jgi:hypothetical protein
MTEPPTMFPADLPSSVMPDQYPGWPASYLSRARRLATGASGHNAVMLLLLLLIVLIVLAFGGGLGYRGGAYRGGGIGLGGILLIILLVLLLTGSINF